MDDTYSLDIDLPEDPYDVQANVLAYLEERFTGEDLKNLKEAFAELCGEVSP